MMTYEPADLDLRNLDLTDPHLRSDPYPLYARLRAEAPVVRNDAMGYWLITRYDDVLSSLKKPKLFSNDSFSDRPVSQHNPQNSEHALLLQAFGSAMIFLDPPEHTRLRKLVVRPFTPSNILSRRDDLAELCRSLLLNARDLTDFDFIRDFAAPFPILVIAELLGVPVSDRDMIKELSYQFGILFEPLLPQDERTTALDGSVELAQYLDETVAERRRVAGDDIISILVEAQEDGDSLTGDELRGTLLHLLVAGNETSTSLITHTKLIFDQMPHIRDEIAAHPGRAKLSVDEVLRYDPPLQMVTRQATEDVEIHGQNIAEGDLVALVIGSANRDENVFSAADTFDLSRANNAKYLSFGNGAHFCVGSVLSKLEGEIAAQLLATEFADIEVDPDAGVRRPDQLIRGYLSLPARFTSHAAAL